MSAVIRRVVTLQNAVFMPMAIAIKAMPITGVAESSAGGSGVTTGKH